MVQPISNIVLNNGLFLNEYLVFAQNGTTSNFIIRRHSCFHFILLKLNKITINELAQSIMALCLVSEMVQMSESIAQLLLSISVCPF